jgi:hypothetical protein
MTDQPLLPAPAPLPRPWWKRWWVLTYLALLGPMTVVISYKVYLWNAPIAQVGVYTGVHKPIDDVPLVFAYAVLLAMPIVTWLSGRRDVVRSSPVARVFLVLVVIVFVAAALFLALAGFVLLTCLVAARKS